MPKQPANKWIVSATVLIGTIMAVLDSSVVNVALPDMSGTLGATIEEITWVVTGYILATVIVMPLTPCSLSAFFTSSSLKCRMMASTFFMVLGSLLADVMLVVVDPRVRAD